MQSIDLATQTTFAELLQRTLDADFDEQFPERGTFRIDSEWLVLRLDTNDLVAEFKLVQD